MIDSFEVALGEGIHALDYNVRAWHTDGYAVVSGCEPAVGAGDLDVEITSGAAYYDGSQVDVANQTVTLDSGEVDPRKDTIYLDSNGSLSVEKGTSTGRLPEGGGRFETFAPAPPLPAGGPHVVVAEVFVPAGSNSIGSADVRDRRVSSEARVHDVKVDELDVEPLAEGTFVAQGDERPAAEHTVVGVTSDETQAVEVLLAPDASPGFAADYDYNYEHTRRYDTGNDDVNVEIVVEWDTDPGDGNDVTLAYQVVPRY